MTNLQSTKLILLFLSLTENLNLFSNAFTITQSKPTLMMMMKTNPFISLSNNHYDHHHRQPTLLHAISPEFDEVCETTGVTLTRFMHEVEKVNPELAELAQLISGIQTASKAISNLVKRSQLPSSSVLGLEGAVNVQGEDQKKLDVITNDVLKRALKHTGTVGVLASEEEDTPMNMISMQNNEDKDVIYDEGSSYVTVSHTYIYRAK